MELSRNTSLDSTPLSVFEGIIRRLSSTGANEIIPLHQGKTVFTTPVDLRHWSRDDFEHPPYHDGPTCGSEQLLCAIQEKLEAQQDRKIDEICLQVTNGITHALSICFHTILNPGDEVLVLSPHWLFVNGLINGLGASTIEVPFFSADHELDVGDLDRYLKPYVNAKTRAIYFNSPNNPTGKVLTRAQTRGLIEFAKKNRLWIVADNAYEYYDFSEEGFFDAGQLEEAREITFSTYSFSKTYGLTGYRIGYLLSPRHMAELARKFGLYSIYSVSTVAQFVALSALRVHEQHIDKHRDFVERCMRITNESLEVPATKSIGGFYTFIDLKRWHSGTNDFINHCIDHGVSLAPGSVFGAAYRNYARLCYSVVEPENLEKGIEIVNRIYYEGIKSR